MIYSTFKSSMQVSVETLLSYLLLAPCVGSPVIPLQKVNNAEF